MVFVHTSQRVIDASCVRRSSFFFLYFSHGMRLDPFGTAATVWPIVPAPDNDSDCGAIGGIRIGRTNRSSWRKPAPNVTFSTTNPT
jgi:hypothetical protein